MPPDGTRDMLQVKRELKRWGLFWRHYEHLSIGGSLMASFIQSQQSATKYHRRMLVGRKYGDTANKCKGVERPYSAGGSQSFTPNLSSSGEVKVPWSLQELDELIEQIKPECRQALGRAYIKGDYDGAKGFWLNKAHMIVLSALQTGKY